MCGEGPPERRGGGGEAGEGGEGAGGEGGGVQEGSCPAGTGHGHFSGAESTGGETETQS